MGGAAPEAGALCLWHLPYAHNAAGPGYGDLRPGIVQVPEPEAYPVGDRGGLTAGRIKIKSSC
jgi:hypothetical protein